MSLHIWIFLFLHKVFKDMPWSSFHRNGGFSPVWEQFQTRHTFLALIQGWQKWQSSYHPILLVSSFLNDVGITASPNNSVLMVPSESFSLHHWAILTYVSSSTCSIHVKPQRSFMWDGATQHRCSPALTEKLLYSKQRWEFIALNMDSRRIY